MADTWQYRGAMDPENGPKVEWVLERLRARRNALLAASDWTQLADVAPAVQQAWASYRQALRDLPQTTADPRSAKWPTPPTAT